MMDEAKSVPVDELEGVPPNYRSILDKGFVRLVSYMQPVPTPERDGPPIDPMCRGWTGDLEIVRNARVSFNADWRTGENEGADERLINYMMRNKHTSPFEAMVFTFEIKCPLFVARQWHRHRTWSYNELSARYAPMQEEFYIPAIDAIGVQSKDNKQARELNVPKGAEQTERHRLFLNELAVRCDEAFGTYNKWLEMGIPKEIARIGLPLNTYTRYFGTVDLHNLFHFIRLRWHAHAQHEIQQYAFGLFQLIEPICPKACKAFMAWLGRIDVAEQTLKLAERYLSDDEMDQEAYLSELEFLLDAV